MAGGESAEPDRAELYAELVRFMREGGAGVRRRAFRRIPAGALRLGGRGTEGARAVRGATPCQSVEAAEQVLLNACPEARELLIGHAAEIDLLPTSESD